MEDLDHIIKTISLSMGAAWGSGINLYATIFVLGMMGSSGNIILPETLVLLQDPMVMAAAGLMYIVEFFADKVPGVDTGWDSIHTFIRIPAGAMLAAGSVGDVSPAVAVAAAIVGGGLSAGSHATKAGSRVIINTSPEPFSNWAASLVEDVAVIAGMWTCLNYPLVFIVLLVLFIILIIWLIPKIWLGIKKIFGFIGRLIGVNRT